MDEAKDGWGPKRKKKDSTKLQLPKQQKATEPHQNMEMLSKVHVLKGTFVQELCKSWSGIEGFFWTEVGPDQTHILTLNLMGFVQL